MSNKRVILLWITVVFLSFSLSATWTFAKGKQKRQRSGTHSGWVKGEKKGWEADVSPGLEKKDQEWNEETERLKEKKHKNKFREKTFTYDDKEVKEKEEKERERKQKQQKFGEQEHHRERHQKEEGQKE